MSITIPTTGGGDIAPVIATESISGQHYQLFKLVDGNTGQTGTVGTSANPLFVTGSVGAAQLGAPWSVTGSLNATVVAGSVNASVVAGSLNATVAAGSLNATAFGNVAAGVADAGNPIKIGGYASDSISPTVVSSGQRVNTWYDQTGRQIMRPHAPRGLTIQQFTTIANSNETTVLAAAGAGIFHDITYVSVTNRSPTAVRVDFRPNSGGAVAFTISVPSSAAGAHYSETFKPPLPVYQNSAAGIWTAQLGSGSTVAVSVNDVQIFVQAVKVTG